MRRAGHDGSADDHARTTRGAEDRTDLVRSRQIQQLTIASGYVALGLLSVTLLLGPLNLVLRKRNPISTYLRRDVGIWTAAFNIVHVVSAALIHVSHGSGLVATILHFFLAEDGTPLGNSFGLGNWTGLAALLIVLALLATSSDIALRTLKARPWKWIQRLTYLLFVLVVLHTFFYGALLRITSPFTLLLLLSVITVSVGQATGFLIWRRRSAPGAVRA
jgi:sulfoxide reductase heme-binding subunit YedZ